MFAALAASIFALVSCGKGEVVIAAADAPFSGVIIYDGDSEEAKNAANEFTDIAITIAAIKNRTEIFFIFISPFVYIKSYYVPPQCRPIADYSKPACAGG